MAWDFDGTSVTVEIAPDDGLWAETPTWVDISAYVRDIPVMASSGRTSDIDQTQPGQLEVICSNRDRTFDTAYGPASVAWPGTTGNYWSTPDDAAFSGAGELDVRFAYAADDWTPTNVDTIIGQYGASGQRSWRVGINTSGYLQLITSANGTTLSTRDSGVRVAAVDGQVMACRVTWDNATGETRYYIKRTTVARCVQDARSDSGWMQLGATDTGVTHTLHNSTEAVTVGAQADGNSSADGALYYVQAATAIDGTPAVVWWPKDAASTAATSWVSSETGETWTQTGSTTVKVQGTYFGRLLPGTPIRVYATRSGTDYPLWSGYLRRAPMAYPSVGLDAEVRLQATDTLGWLQDMPAPESPSQWGYDAPGSFWGLHEQVNVLEVSDSLGTNPGTWSGVRSAGGVTQPGAPSLTTSRLTGGVYVVVPDVMPWDFTDGCYLSFNVYIASPTDTFRVFVSDGSNTIGINYGAGDGGYYTQSLAAANAIEFPERLTVGAHTFTMYQLGLPAFDGVLADGATRALFSTTSGMIVGGVGATVSDIACTLAPAFITFDGPHGGAGQTTVERLTSITESVNLPAALCDFPASTSTYLGPTALGVTWGELVRQCAPAEQGRLYVDGDGVLVFRSKAWVWTDTASTTSQATFGESEVPYVDITISPADRSDVINDCTVTLPNGSAGRYVDSESVTANGRRGQSFAAPMSSPADAQSLARHIVGLRAWPRTRITSMTLNPRSASNVWAQVLERQIGDRVTVIRRPTDTLTGGTATEPNTAQVTWEQVTHSISRNGTWTARVQLAEAQPTAAEAGYLTLDDSVLGVLDAGNSLAY